MILTCPQCATRYQADAAKFQPSGRNVRCAKCSHLWHQDAPAPEPASDFAVVDETSAPPDPPSPPPEPIPQPVAFVPRPQPMAYVPNPVISREELNTVEPSHARWPQQLMLGAGWAGLVAIVLVVGWSALTFRQQIATLWPQSASFYAALGMKANATGLDIEDVSYHRGMENGQSVLTVTGILANAGPRELPVPQLRVGLIDDDRRELYHWTFVAGVMTLRPGQSTKFRTRLTNPPQGARQFELRFAKAGE
jgi:predicted Zn finger-like uncharacterized protein